MAGGLPVDCPPGTREDTMITRMLKTITAGATVVAACLLPANPAVAAPPSSNAYKLGGAWQVHTADIRLGQH